MGPLWCCNKDRLLFMEIALCNLDDVSGVRSSWKRCKHSFLFVRKCLGSDERVLVRGVYCQESGDTKKTIQYSAICYTQIYLNLNIQSQPRQSKK